MAGTGSAITQRVPVRAAELCPPLDNLVAGVVEVPLKPAARLERPDGPAGEQPRRLSPPPADLTERCPCLTRFDGHSRTMRTLGQVRAAALAWLGRKLRIPALVLGGLVLVLLVREQTARRANPNPDPVAYLGAEGVPQVVLKENQVRQYVANGRINGTTVEFLVDTGAVDVAMPLMVAQTLGLELRPGGVSKTGNGDVRTWVARLDSVDVGGLVAYDLSATVLPNMQGDQVLLGMAYLRRMELVLRGGEMTLRPYRR